MITIDNKENCCGCTACESICPRNAISMSADSYGFVFPKIELKDCIDCGLCEKVCPIKNILSGNKPVKSYVAAAKDEKTQLASTSGGIASVISKYVIENLNGVVYGCTGMDSKHVKHIRIDKLDELYLLKGSKYVQSDISNIFPLIKKDLANGRFVLFIGTPCQNAGLKSFLRKDYINLYCIDFICHGVPSQQMLSDAINELGFGGIDTQAVFRYKNKGKSIYGLRIISEKTILYKKEYGTDAYISAFLNGLNYRESCYACKFATPERVSDITIGDFWDREKEYINFLNHKNGLSQININTDKGYSLFESIKNYINYETISFNKLLAHSEQLHEPMPRHISTETFYRLYKKNNFIQACKISLSSFFSYYKRSRYLAYVYMIPGTFKIVQFIKKIIKR